MKRERGEARRSGGHYNTKTSVIDKVGSGEL